MRRMCMIVVPRIRGDEDKLINSEFLEGMLFKVLSTRPVRGPLA